MTKLKYLKLMNGEDIVAIEDSESFYRMNFKMPVQVTQYRIEETGEIAYEIIPWTFSANTDMVSLKKKDILCVLEAKQHLKEQYAVFVQVDKKREEFLDQPLRKKQEAIEQYIIKQNLHRESH